MILIIQFRLRCWIVWLAIIWVSFLSKSTNGSGIESNVGNIDSSGGSSGSIIASSNANDVAMLSLGLLTSNGALSLYEDVLSSYYIQPIAVKHFNERDPSVIRELGSLKGCKAKLRFATGTILDVGGSTSESMEKFVTAYNDEGVDIINGPARSDVAIAIGVTAGALRVPIVSHFVTSNVLADKTIYPTFFRVIPTSSQYAEVLGSLIEKFEFEKIGILFINDEYGNAIKNALFDYCQANGIGLVSGSFEATARGGPELEAALRRTMRLYVNEGINVIYFTPTAFDVIHSIAIAAHQLDWIKGKLYIHQTTEIKDIVSKAPNATVASIVAQFFHGSLNVFYAFDEQNAAWNRLVDAWNAFDPDDVNPFVPNATTPKGQPYTIAADYFTSRRSIVSTLRYLAVGYDSVIAIGLAACGKYTGGGSRAADITRNLRTVVFQGTSGLIAFDERQDRLADTFISYADNIQVSLSGNQGEGSGGNETFSAQVKSVRMGILSHNNWTMVKSPSEPFVFSDGTGNLPKAFEPPDHVIETLPLSAKVVGWVETAIAMLFGSMSLFYLLWFRNDRRVIHSHPSFLFLLSMGCMLMGGSILPLTLEGDAACMLYPWLFSIGFTLAISSLSAKTISLAALFQMKQDSPNNSINTSPPHIVRGVQDICGNPQASPPVTDVQLSSVVVGEDPRDFRQSSMKQTLVLLAMILLVLLGDLVIMVSWQLVAPLEFSIVTYRVDADGYPLVSSAICQTKSSTSAGFLATFVAFICVIVLLTMYISFRMRHVIYKVQEVKMTAIATMCMFQAFFVGIPAAAAVWNSPLARFLVLSSLTFLLCLVVLGTIYIPKIMGIRSSLRNTTTGSNARFPSRFRQGSGSVAQVQTRFRPASGSVAHNPIIPDDDKHLGSHYIRFQADGELPTDEMCNDSYASLSLTNQRRDVRNRRTSFPTHATGGIFDNQSPPVYNHHGSAGHHSSGIHPGSAHDIQVDSNNMVGIQSTPQTISGRAAPLFLDGSTVGLGDGTGTDGGRSVLTYVPFIEDPQLRSQMMIEGSASHRFFLEIENIKDVDGNTVVLQ